MVKIGSASVMNLMVGVPTRAEQERVVSYVATFKEHVACEAANLQKLLLLKAGLMEDLLTGRVRVTVDEDAA
jgi:type I restriction enzyme S subunit